MRFLTAFTLILLATSKLAAAEIVPPIAGSLRLAAPAPVQPLVTGLSGLFNPIAETGVGKFVPYDDGPAAVAQTDEAAPETICETLVTAAAANDLPLAFFLRLIWQESRFDPLAISRAGAQGVAQFMPRVAAAMGLTDPFDPAQALPISARFLRTLRQQFGNLGLAAAAYNAGSGRIQNWLAKRGKLPKETRDYVMNITGHAPERWVNASPSSISMKVPARLPCRMPESAMAAMVPMPPERPQGTAPETVTTEDSSIEKANVPARHRSAPRFMLARAVLAQAKMRPSSAKPEIATPPDRKTSANVKMLARAKQQRAIIFVDHRSSAVRVKLADKPAKRGQVRLAEKSAPSKPGRSKLAEKSAPPKHSQTKIAEKSAPPKHSQTKVAEKSTPPKHSHTKIAEKSTPPQRVRVALATRSR